MSIVEPGWALAGQSNLALFTKTLTITATWKTGYNIKSRYQIKENWFALKLSLRDSREVWQQQRVSLHNISHSLNTEGRLGFILRIL